MVKLIVLSVLLNAGEIETLPSYDTENSAENRRFDFHSSMIIMNKGNEDTVPEARRRGKGNKKRKRGGNGLR